MSEIKRCFEKMLLFAVAVLLCAYGSADAQRDIIDHSAVNSDGQIGYRTASAVVTDMDQTVTVSGEMYYPMGCDVRFVQSGARFERYAVKPGDRVKQGDILLYYTVETSEAEAARAELALTRAQEELNAGSRERQEQIARMRAQVSAEKNSYEKEKKTIELRALEAEAKQFRFEQEWQMLIHGRVLEQQRQPARRTLIAPSDGVIEYAAEKIPGSTLTEGELLIHMRKEEHVLIAVDNADGCFRYNMAVSVTVGSGEYSGRVSAESADGSRAYISLDEECEVLGNTEITVSAKVRQIEAVLTVPCGALMRENGRYFVNRLADGMIEKRFVEVGIMTEEAAWILSGIAEGDMLVLK